MSSPARDDIRTLRDALTAAEYHQSILGHDSMCRSLFADPGECNCSVEEYRQGRAALSRLEALRDAARDRLPYGHNDTCDFELGAGDYECSCGHDALRAALAACDNETSRT